MSDKTWFGVLDENNALVDYAHLSEKQVEAQSRVLVEVSAACDLPTDGTYKWVPEEAAFFPLGKGFGRPRQAPIDTEHMLYLLLRAVQNGRSVPAEVADWADWYEENLLKAQEEARGK